MLGIDPVSKLRVAMCIVPALPISCLELHSTCLALGGTSFLFVALTTDFSMRRCDCFSLSMTDASSTENVHLVAKFSLRLLLLRKK